MLLTCLIQMQMKSFSQTEIKNHVTISLTFWLKSHTSLKRNLCAVLYQYKLIWNYTFAHVGLNFSSRAVFIAPSSIALFRLQYHNLKVVVRNSQELHVSPAIPYRSTLRTLNDFINRKLLFKINKENKILKNGSGQNKGISGASFKVVKSHKCSPYQIIST